MILEKPPERGREASRRRCGEVVIVEHQDSPVRCRPTYGVRAQLIVQIKNAGARWQAIKRCHRIGRMDGDV